MKRSRFPEHRAELRVQQHHDLQRRQPPALGGLRTLDSEAERSARGGAARSRSRNRRTPLCARRTGRQGICADIMSTAAGTFVTLFDWPERPHRIVVLDVDKPEPVFTSGDVAAAEVGGEGFGFCGLHLSSEAALVTLAHCALHDVMRKHDMYKAKGQFRTFDTRSGTLVADFARQGGESNGSNGPPRSTVGAVGSRRGVPRWRAEPALWRSGTSAPARNCRHHHRRLPRRTVLPRRALARAPAPRRGRDLLLSGRSLKNIGPAFAGPTFRRSVMTITGAG